ncbi:MAG: methylaspartate mutase accessory protein GlmL [Halothermotrichaceae bacterium]
MKTALLIDIGSTYTKVVLLDLDQIQIIGRSQFYTTVDKDVTIGLKKALAGVDGWQQAEYKLACSSAAGGLKIAAVGLVPDLTAEAARRAALGAGGKVIKTYSYQLTEDDIKEIAQKQVDILLLAGGTNGGNKDNILYNARKIAASNLTQPLVVAGNRNAAAEVNNILKKGGKEVYPTENVMPKLEELNIEPARQTIREIFLKKIVEAKGLADVNKIIDELIMPTPSAVLKAAQLLADGSGSEKGLGELMVVDIGGATTDVHSIAEGNPQQVNVNLRGLKEPYVKRTVEGDLGIRYNAWTIYQVIGRENFYKQLNTETDGISIAECDRIINKFKNNVDYIGVEPAEIKIENKLARNAARLAVSRHVGCLETIYTPMGTSQVQMGKDLSQIEYIIGTGGVIVNNSQAEFILLGALYKNQHNKKLLAPLEPEIIIDREYLLAAAGLLAERKPEISLKFLKKYLLE